RVFHERRPRPSQPLRHAREGGTPRPTSPETCPRHQGRSRAAIASGRGSKACRVPGSLRSLRRYQCACGKAGQEGKRTMNLEASTAGRQTPRAGYQHVTHAGASLSVAISVCLLPVIGAAQEPPVQLEPVVVSASGFAQPLADAIPHTSVHGREDIARSGHTDLAGLLAGVVGLDLVRSGGAGGLTSTFMRGAESRQVLFLVDGVRIESGTAGTARIENLLLEQVERVEVVRGNVSALYGSAAVGGVVQVFTRRGEGPPRGNASIGFGS